MFKQYLEYRDGELYWKAKTHPNSSIHIGDKVGRKRISGYVQVQLFNKQNCAHRVIYEMFNGKIPEGLQIDHVNGVKDDNRIENLQLVTHKQNQQRKNYSKGYTFKKNLIRPYEAQKKLDGKSYHLGLFGTPSGAYMANRMFFIRGLHE